MGAPRAFEIQYERTEVRRRGWLRLSLEMSSTACARELSFARPGRTRHFGTGRLRSAADHRRQ
eukprot:6183176-Pleurochrysis_carterae.AAC.1